MQITLQSIVRQHFFYTYYYIGNILLQQTNYNLS